MLPYIAYMDPMIWGIQLQCRNELDVTLFSHDRRLVFQRSKTCDEWGLWHAVIWGYTLSCPNNEPSVLKFIRVVFCEPHLGTVGGDMISSIPFAFGNHSYGHPPFFRERDASRSPKLCGFEHVFEYFMCYLLLFHLTYRIHLCYIYIYIW